jgi:hypothetical protein
MSTKERKRRETRRRRHSEASRRRRSLLAAGGLTAGATLALAGPAQAATTFTVGTNADTTGASDCTTPTNTDCSLRQAILDANTNPGSDTIVFASSLSGQTIVLGSDPAKITEAVAIQGPGAGQLTVDGNGTYRDFDVEPTSAGDVVSISGLTITDGYASANGGAVFNSGANLTLSNVLVENSYTNGTTKYHGGGVFSAGPSVTIDHSTVHGNHSWQGGGVDANGGVVTISDSTISGNYADGDPAHSGGRGYGGGIFSTANVTVDGSTINDNTGAYDGGGIYLTGSGSLAVGNSTIARNHAQNDDGGGIWDYAGGTFSVIGSTVTGNTAATRTGGIEFGGGTGTPVLENSIVSGNSSGTDPHTDDLGYSGPNTFDSAFDLIGVPYNYVNQTVPGSNLPAGTNPGLGPLQNNGGPTMTMAPAITSPVVNQGKAFGLTTDQRGLTRPVAYPGVPNSSAAGADGSDIGAVELQLPSKPTPASNPNPVAGPPNCRALRRKLRRQKHRLSKAVNGHKRSIIRSNIRDTKHRLKKRGC